MVQITQVDMTVLIDFEVEYGLPEFHDTPLKERARKIRFVRIRNASNDVAALMMWLAQKCLFYADWWVGHEVDDDYELCSYGLRELAELPVPGQMRLGENG